MLNAIIIDNEPVSVRTVDLLINEHFRDAITVIGKAYSMVDAIKIINQLKPDIVFLDIELEPGRGFDVLEAIPDRTFVTIFFSVYEEYAIKAFRYSAIDYILKPIDVDEFKEAVRKAIDTLKIHGQSYKRNDVLLQNLNQGNPRKLTLTTPNSMVFIDLDDIIHIKGQGAYAHIYTNKNQNFMTTKSIGQLEEIIDAAIFVRCHNSHIVNTHYVKAINKDGMVVMYDGTEIPTTRRRKNDLIEILNNNFVHKQ